MEWIRYTALLFYAIQNCHTGEKQCPRGCTSWGKTREKTVCHFKPLKAL